MKTNTVETKTTTRELAIVRMLTEDQWSTQQRITDSRETLSLQVSPATIENEQRIEEILSIIDGVSIPGRDREESLDYIDCLPELHPKRERELSALPPLQITRAFPCPRKAICRSHFPDSTKAEKKTIDGFVGKSRNEKGSKNRSSDEWYMEDMTQEVFLTCLEKGIPISEETIPLIKTAIKHRYINKISKVENQSVSVEFEGDEEKTDYSFMEDSRLSTLERLQEMENREINNKESLSGYLSKYLSPEEYKLFDALYVEGLSQTEYAQDSDKNLRTVQRKVRKLNDKLPGIVTIRDKKYMGGGRMSSIPTAETVNAALVNDTMCHDTKLAYLKQRSAFLSFLCTENKPAHKGKFVAPDAVISMEETERIFGPIRREYVYVKGSGLILSPYGLEKKRLKDKLKEASKGTMDQARWAVVRELNKELKTLENPVFSGKYLGFRALVRLSTTRDVPESYVVKRRAT